MTFPVHICRALRRTPWHVCWCLAANVYCIQSKSRHKLTLTLVLSSTTTKLLIFLRSVLPFFFNRTAYTNLTSQWRETDWQRWGYAPFVFSCWFSLYWLWIVASGERWHVCHVIHFSYLTQMTPFLEILIRRRRLDGPTHMPNKMTAMKWQM